MPVDAQVLALMVENFDWKRKTGQDAWQNATFANPVSIRGLHEDSIHTVEDNEGNKRVAQGIVYLEDVYPIDTADELWFNGKVLGDTIRVDTWPDPRTGGGYASVVHHG